MNDFTQNERTGLYAEGLQSRRHTRHKIRKGGNEHGCMRLQEIMCDFSCSNALVWKKFDEPAEKLDALKLTLRSIHAQAGPSMKPAEALDIKL